MRICTWTRSLQGLGGDAAAVEAGAAQQGGFHQGHFRPGLGRFERGGIPAGSGADDGYAHGHCQFPLVGLSVRDFRSPRRTGIETEPNLNLVPKVPCAPGARNIRAFFHRAA